MLQFPPPLERHLEELLVEALRLDELGAMVNDSGRLTQDLERAQKFARNRELPQRVKLELLRQIGDCSLFLTGVLPESLTPRHGQRRLEQYVELGRRAFFDASQSPIELHEGQREVFGLISEEFERCRRVLFRIRQDLWELRAA